MFEVLVFVYENYWRGDACPEPQQLGRKLSAHGFEPEEIRDALHWLDGLSLATQGLQLERSPGDDTVATVTLRGAPEAALPQSDNAMRVYSQAEQEHLGADCLGFIRFLESSNVLSCGLREIVPQSSRTSCRYATPFRGQLQAPNSAVVPDSRRAWPAPRAWRAP
nr:DUF494 domain-containing protein [Variovorax paradoxus]